MIEEEMKVGPKGQVVIPKYLRTALKIGPGSKVVFRLEGEKLVIVKPSYDAVSVFEAIARSGPSIKKVMPHVYEEEIMQRFQL